MLRSKLKEYIIGLYKKRRENQIYKKEIINIKRKDFILQQIKLTDEQEREIQEYFKTNYGKSISTKWHRLYQSYLGKYDKKYFPEILFSTYLEKKLNDLSVCKVLEDKALLEVLFSDIKGLKLPHTLVLKVDNVCYDESRNYITNDFLEKKLNNAGKVLFKKTVGSCSGKSIKVCDFKDGVDLLSKKTVAQIVNEYNENFIVQKVEKNCAEIAKIYSNSLNTFRVMTYVIDEKIYHVPITLRLGRNKSVVDNLHAGGIMVGVKDDGYLQPYAFTEYHETFSEHPDSHVLFNNYHISNVDNVIKMAYECHKKLVHVGIASWDFAINQNNDIVLIEVNLGGQSIWFPQMSNGCSAFGDNTEYMLNLIRKR